MSNERIVVLAIAALVGGLVYEWLFKRMVEV